MQPTPDSPLDNSTPTYPGQQPADSSTLHVFQPVKPPLRERNLVRTTVRVVFFLLAGIACAALTVGWFLPTQLPWLP